MNYMHKGIALRLFRQLGARINYPTAPLAIGYNSQQELRNGCCYGRHAETDAISKLPRRRGRHIKKIDIIVLRLTPSGDHATYSKPCSNCIKHMIHISKYNYRVRYVWYTDYNGDIIRTTLDMLNNDTEKYDSCRFRRKKKSTPCRHPKQHPHPQKDKRHRKQIKKT